MAGGGTSAAGEVNGYSRDRGIILKFWLENVEKHLPFQEKSVIINERVM